MKNMIKYLYKDKVFIIALSAAVISAFFVHPNLGYLDYVNAKVLIIMFTLMIAVAGIFETHFFDFVATKLVLHLKSIKWTAVVIVLATFFLAMLLTNDAVLLTLVPFTLFITKYTHHEKHALFIIIMQTIAANMGSALTPMGDPQNIYLYAFYDIPFNDFLNVTFPITFIGFILVFITTLIFIPHITCELNLLAPKVDLKRLLFYFIILLNALLTVLRIVPEYYTLMITLILTLLFCRHLFKRVDYTLLLTFLSFFIFTGNLSQLQSLGEGIRSVLETETQVLFTGLIASQFISNVPAAVLLSTFTPPHLWPSLLRGVNIGAMGTIIASLASLISFKYILKEYPNQVKKYLLQYSIVSIVFITVILLIIFIL